MKLKALLIITIISAGLLGCQEDEPKSGSDNQGSETELDDKQQASQDPKEGEGQDEDGENENKETDKSGESEDENDEGKEGIVTVDNPESLQVLVNKQRKLPDGYEPPDLTAPDVPFYFEEDLEKRYMRETAASALEDLFRGAEQAGLDLVAASGYRSYERQKQIYQQNVESRGQEEADKFSARPGTSEHQTGLAMDVTSAEVAFALEQTFKQTDEGQWLADNAHNYGFIIRYPEGKSDITGYSYEPWHLRYVGKDIAEEIYNQDITLEEYFD
ncbi:M15 family metallopeptidase [Sediminibacillus albus]|uniref:D-alanyl-D-alanine carboxypeptidase n=1 Tax=Sediminibacillus albus TaxID=407036 RepID=A0A1G8XFZ5_9BACI|nr:M15 family metallopeptidase [Sediminibacillus albus]SDJ89413.1 D-alanyl-D-alanine carboxypeptidase [Sediminibacillus albus]